MKKQNNNYTNVSEELNVNRLGKLSEMQTIRLVRASKIRGIIILMLGLLSLLISILSLLPLFIGGLEEAGVFGKIMIVVTGVVFICLGIFLSGGGVKNLLAVKEITSAKVMKVNGIPEFGGNIHWRVYKGTFAVIPNPHYFIDGKEYFTFPFNLLSEVSGTNITAYFIELPDDNRISPFSKEKRRVIINYE
ncbi:hypothetical protein J4434_00025 [Candidatus Woesearchaeota archaeon]|nr:hypothetical protein [Candidatus Woesearchaeota archaeon]